MIYKLIVIAALQILPVPAGLVPSPAADNAAFDAATRYAPLPFQAVYQANYKGKNLGRARLYLQPLQDGWQIDYRMKATRGFASVVGANLREEARFRWLDGHLQPLFFKHRSKAFLSKKKWHAEFDGQQQQIFGKSSGNEYSLDNRAGLLDPLSAFVHVAQQTAQMKQDWILPSVMKGEQRDYRYQAVADETLDTQCGIFKTRKMLRTRETSSATQELWYSDQIWIVPIRIRNTQRDGDVLDLQLTALTVDGALFCGEADDIRALDD